MSKEILEKSFNDVLKVANEFVNKIWLKDREEGIKLHNILQNAFDSHNQAVTLLKQPNIPHPCNYVNLKQAEQSPVGEFTKKVRLSVQNRESIIAKITDIRLLAVIGWIPQLCDQLDRAEEDCKDISAIAASLKEDIFKELAKNRLIIDRLDRAEAINKDLLETCYSGLAKAKGLAKISKELGLPEDTPGDKENKRDIEILEAAIAKAKKEGGFKSEITKKMSFKRRQTCRQVGGAKCRNIEK